MTAKSLIQIIIIVLFTVILGSLMFGFFLGSMILSLYYNPFTAIAFSVLVFPFFIWSFWKQFRLKRWFVIVKNFFAIFFIATFLNVMFSLEEGIITFNDFDWIIIYSCIGFVFLIILTFLIASKYFNETRIYKECEHIINGMILSGLLPEFDDKKE